MNNGSLTVEKASLEMASGLCDLYSKAYANKYSLLEFTNEALIKTKILDPGYIWYVATDGSKVVGSSVGIIDNFNNSVEYGRTAVAPEYLKSGIASALTSRVHEHAQCAEIDLCWGTVRNDAMLHIASENLSMGIAGYLPGAYRVHQRELHLLTYRLFDRGKHKRVAWERGSVYSSPSVKKILGDSMGCPLQTAYDYPLLGDVPMGLDGLLKGTFASNDLSFHIKNLPENPLPEYLDCILLVSQKKEINFLRSLRFQMVGFLPAWKAIGPQRYDCILMANPLNGYACPSGSFATIADELAAGFDQGDIYG